METNQYNDVPFGFGSIGSSDPISPNQANNQNNSDANNSENVNNNEARTNNGNANNSGTSYNKNPKPASAPNSKKAGQLENFIGKNLMGIMASVLVVIGLILLVTAASEYITDLIKVILIFGISLTMLAIGYITNIKHRNGFSMSLCGCGVGAVYLSIFLTFGYFHMVNVIVMFAMAAVWSIIVFFIGGKVSKASALFHITGQIGLLISLCYGMVEMFNVDAEQPELFAIALLVFYICVTVFYAVLNRGENKVESVVVLIMNLLGMLFMFTAYSRVVANYQVWQQAVFTAVLLSYALWLSFISYMKFGRIVPEAYDALTGKVIQTRGDSSGWAIYFCINVILSGIGLLVCCRIDVDATWILPLIGLLYVILSWILVALRKRDDGIFVACSVVLLIWAIIFISGLSIVADLFGIGIITIPLLIVAIITKNRVIMLMNVLSVVAFSFHDAKYPALYAMLMMLFVLSSLATLINIKKFSHAGYKLALMLATTFALFQIPIILAEQYDIVRITSETIVFVFYAVIIFTSLLVTNIRLKNKNNYDTTLHVGLNVFNVIAMLYGLHVVYGSQSMVLHILSMLVLLLLVVVNLPGMYKSKDVASTLYSAIKLTAYVVLMLNSFEVEMAILSLACLLISIASIILGFVTEKKSIRVYGLILAIVSILKLVFADLKFDSNITRAIVVLASGIVTFGICYIYNLVSRKADEKEKLANEAVTDEMPVDEAKMDENEGE